MMISVYYRQPYVSPKTINGIGCYHISERINTANQAQMQSHENDKRFAIWYYGVTIGISLYIVIIVTIIIIS